MAKYSNREDRDIRKTIEQTPPYPSRKSIKCKYDIERVVNKFSHGLNGLNDADLLDKYYMPGHVPSRDIMTELGDTPSSSTTNKVSLGLLALGIFLLLNS